jgi:hypothetical protein
MAAPDQSASPGTQAKAQRELDSIKRLRCVFEVLVRGRWDGTEPEVRRASGRNLLDLTIRDIDVQDGSAEVVRAGHPTPVSAQSDRSNLYFVDTTGTGGMVTLTTVFSDEVRPGYLKAVQTRSGPASEQFYGSCQILK